MLHPACHAEVQCKHASQTCHAGAVPYNPYGEISIHGKDIFAKYFPVAPLNREKSEDQNDIYIMAFTLKGKVLKIDKEKVISTCSRGHYVML